MEIWWAKSNRVGPSKHMFMEELITVHSPDQLCCEDAITLHKTETFNLTLRLQTTCISNSYTESIYSCLQLSSVCLCVVRVSQWLSWYWKCHLFRNCCKFGTALPSVLSNKPAMFKVDQKNGSLHMWTTERQKDRQRFRATLHFLLIHSTCFYFILCCEIYQQQFHICVQHLICLLSAC